MSKAITRLVEASAEHVHREFQDEFGFSMTIDELVALQNLLTKHLTACMESGKRDEHG